MKRAEGDRRHDPQPDRHLRSLLLRCDGYRRGVRRVVLPPQSPTAADLDAALAALRVPIADGPGTPTAEAPGPLLEVLGGESVTAGEAMAFVQQAGRRQAAALVPATALPALGRASAPHLRIGSADYYAFPPPARFPLPLGIVSRLTAALVLLVAAPVLALAAVAIALQDRGPVFFRQERLGLGARPFRILKLRTMTVGADQARGDLDDRNEVGEGLFKIESDPRVTPLGRVLRRFSIDELPQLLNVLAGDMALVGPRPLPVADCESFVDTWHGIRYETVPGLTGLWQVCGRHRVPFDEMCQLDAFYVRNRTAGMDLRIMLRTVRPLLFGDGV